MFIEELVLRLDYETYPLINLISSTSWGGKLGDVGWGIGGGMNPEVGLKAGRLDPWGGM